MKIAIQTTKAYTWGENCMGWSLLSTEGVGVKQELMPSGTSERLHYHEYSRQFFYILSGTATFDIDGERHMVSEREAIHIPPKSLHRISNLHTQNLEFILVSQPDILGDRIELLE